MQYISINFKKARTHITNYDKWKAINIHVHSFSSKKINLYWDSHKKTALSKGGKRHTHYVNWCIFIKTRLLKVVWYFSSLTIMLFLPLQLIKHTLLMGSDSTFKIFTYLKVDLSTRN